MNPDPHDPQADSPLPHAARSIDERLPIVHSLFCPLLRFVRELGESFTVCAVVVHYKMTRSSVHASEGRRVTARFHPESYVPPLRKQ